MARIRAKAIARVRVRAVAKIRARAVARVRARAVVMVGQVRSVGKAMCSRRCCHVVPFMWAFMAVDNCC